MSKKLTTSVDVDARAVGDNASFTGGHTKSNIHLDGILLQPTVKIDKNLLLRNGKLLVK